MNTNADEAVITYDHVNVRYGKRLAAADIHFSVRAGEIVGIAGESGSGKSTILKAAMDLLGPGGSVSGGHIWFQGRDLARITGAALRRFCGAEIAMVFQDAGAYWCPVRTIGSQLYEMVSAHRKAGKKEVKESAAAVFETLGLSGREAVWDRYPFELSGGMNQRVAVAASLLLRPKVLLADEPTSALDVCARRQVLRELLRLRDGWGTSVVVVTHDMDVLSKIADSVVVLQSGRIVERGRTRRVLQAPSHAYTKRLLDAVPHLRRP